MLLILGILCAGFCVKTKKEKMSSVFSGAKFHQAHRAALCTWIPSKAGTTCEELTSLMYSGGNFSPLHGQVCGQVC